MHWTEQRERASNWGIAFLIGVMKLTGPRFVKLLIAPVAVYYFLSSPNVRRVSNDYLTRLLLESKIKGIPVDLPGGCLSWLTFRHILSFSRSMVDRVHAWSAGGGAIRYQIEGKELVDDVLYSKVPHHGAIILVSHLGNFDLAIARNDTIPQRKFNIVLDTSHTKTYNQFRDKIFESGHIQFIDPEEITPLKTISLVEQAANGEVIFIAADRTANANDKNSVLVDFLGSQAAFPSGPYIMANLLEVPVYCLFSLKQHNNCLIRFEMFEQKVVIPRKHRQLAIRQYAQNFASRLERECFNFPFQWYNFYDFWAVDPGAQGKQDEPF